MKYRLTILNVTAFLFIAGCVIYIITKYSTLSKGEGWGVVFMIGLTVFGSTALVVDLIIQRIFKPGRNEHIACAIVLLVCLGLIYFGS